MKTRLYDEINWKIMIPVMLLVSFQNGFNAFSSVLAEMAAYYPDVSATMIQTVLTIPSLISIPVSVLVGVLASVFYKKDMVLVALISELIGGVIPLISHETIVSLLVSSVFIGIGQGVLMSMASAIIGENFSGTTGGVAMGLKQAASSAGVAVLTIATGFLAESLWYRAYFIYFLVIPIIFLTAYLLPRGKKDISILRENKNGEKKKWITGSFVYFCILSFLLSMFSFAFYTNIGLVITGRGLGDSSQVGVVSAWNSLLSIVVGMIFGQIIKKAKRYTLAVSVGIQAAAYMIIIMAQNLHMIIIGSMIYGIGAGIQMIATCHYILESVQKEVSSLAMGICMAVTSLGITFSPIVVNTMADLFGMADAVAAFGVSAGGMFVILIAELVFELFMNKTSCIGR